MLLLLLLLLRRVSGLASRSELPLDLLKNESSHLVGLCDVLSHTRACTALWNQILVPCLPFLGTGPHPFFPTAEERVSWRRSEPTWPAVESGNHMTCSWASPNLHSQTGLNGGQQTTTIPEGTEPVPLFKIQSSPLPHCLHPLMGKNSSWLPRRGDIDSKCWWQNWLPGNSPSQKPSGNLYPNPWKCPCHWVQWYRLKISFLSKIS